MKASMLAASASIALAVTAANPAQARSWTTRWTGPHGGVYEGGGNCANGTCQGSGTFTGPNGGVWRQTGNLHEVAPGQWAGERTRTAAPGRTRGPGVPIEIEWDGGLSTD